MAFEEPTEKECFMRALSTEEKKNFIKELKETVIIAAVALLTVGVKSFYSEDIDSVSDYFNYSGLAFVVYFCISYGLRAFKLNVIDFVSASPKMKLFMILVIIGAIYRALYQLRVRGL